MVEFIEDITKTKFNEEKLKEIIKIENDTKKYMRKFYKSLKCKYFSNTLTLEMYKLFAYHCSLGKKEVLDFYKMQAEDIEKYPDYSGKRILWSHVIPETIFYSISRCWKWKQCRGIKYSRSRKIFKLQKVDLCM